MNKLSCLITGVFCLLLSWQASAQCNYEIELWDAWGDGWAGSSVDVLVDGLVELDDITIAGNSGVFSIPVDTGEDITVVWSTGTNGFPGECAWQLRDAGGTIVQTQGGSYGLGPFSAGGAPSLVDGATVGPFAASCPACASPSGMAVTVTTLSSVELAWSPGGVESTWDIEFFEVGVGSQTMTPTAGFDDVTNNTTLPITGLNSSPSIYNLFYRADCGIDGQSDWIGPVQFTLAAGGSCALPVDVSAGGTFASGSIDGDFDGSIGSCFGSAPDAYRWFEFTTASFGVLDVDNCSAGIDSQVALASGSCGSLTELDCGDDDCSLQSQVSASVSPGTYYIVWGNGWSATGFDFDVTFTPVTCPAPSNLTAAAITESAADLSWDAGNMETEWDLYYGPSPLLAADAATTPTEANVTSNMSYNISGLTSATPYEVYVRADCAPGDSSDWVGPISFTTECPIFTLPYVEDFEGTGLFNGSNFSDPCITTVDNGAYDWEISVGGGGTGSTGTGPATGSNGPDFVFAESSSGSDGDMAELIMPQIDLPVGSAPLLSFDYHMFGITVNQLEVEINDGGGYVNLLTISGPQQSAEGDAWITENVDLCAYAGNIVNIRFVATRGTSFAGDVALDNVNVVNVTCPVVQTVDVTNILDVTADVDWSVSTASCTAAATYEVDVLQGGISIAGYPQTISGTSASLSGLTQGLEYVVRVEPTCDIGAAVETSFNTLNCAPVDRCEYLVILTDTDPDGVDYNGWITGSFVEVSTGGQTLELSIDGSAFGARTDTTIVLACPGDSISFGLIGTPENSGEFYRVEGPGGFSFQPSSANVNEDISVIACPTCAPSFGLSASNECETGVDIAWTNGATYDSVQVSWSYFVPPFFFFNGTSPTLAGTSTSYAFTGEFWPLNTSIDYNVIGFCEESGGVVEQSQVSGTFVTPECNCADQCTYEVRVSETFGDGWEDGGAPGSTNIRVSLDGLAVDSIWPADGVDIDNGDWDTLQVNTCPGAVISFDFTDGASGTDSEIRVEVENISAGLVVYTIGAGGYTGTDGATEEVYSEDACPDCLPPTDLAAINLASDSARVVWTDASGEGDHDYNIVESGQDPLTNGTWTNTSDTTFLATSLMSNTTYDVYVSSTCTAGPSDTVSVSFTTLAGCGSTGVSVCYDDGGSDAELATYTVDTPGDWIEISINAGTFESCCDDFLVWDDVAGGNEIFNGTGNLAGTTITSTTGTIVLGYDSDGSVSCQTTQTAVNFDISCFAAPQCFGVIDLVVDSVASDAILVAWSDTSSLGNVDEYIVTLTDTTNMGTPIVQTVVVPDTSFLFTGLNSEAVHSVTVQTDCSTGGDGLSMVTGPIYGTTRKALPAAPAGVTCTTGLANYVFVEEFESGNPNGWDGDLGGGNTTWDFGTTGGTNSGGTGPATSFSGGTHLEYEASNFGGAGDISEAYSPGIDLTAFAGNGDAELSFYFHAFGVEEEFGDFHLQISTDSVLFDTLFTWSGGYQLTDDEAWVPVGIDITSYLGNTVYLRLSNVEAGSSFEGDFSVDLLRIEACNAACIEPSGLDVTVISETETQLTWSEDGSAIEWSVEFGEGMTQGDVGNDTIPVLLIPSTNVTGLTPGTTYYFWVQADCGPDSSNWVGPFSWVQPIVGATCDLPIEITSIPFSSGAVNTGLYGDDYSTSPCNGSYMGGDDVVFRYTPSVDTCISVSFDAQTTWLGLHILDGCPDDGATTCVVPDGIGTANDDLFTSATGVREVTALNLIGGQDYYFVASTFPSPQSGVFELSLGGCPTCLPLANFGGGATGSDAEITWESQNIGASFFYSYAEDVADLFTASEAGNGTGGPTDGMDTLSISGLAGSTTYFIGIYEDCEPINMGDGGSDTLILNFTTPITNDDCVDAAPIACGDTITGFTTGAAPSTLGFFTGGNENAADVFFTFTGANSDDMGALAGTAGDQVTLSMCNSGYDTKIDVYTSCTPTATDWLGGNDDDCGTRSIFSFPTEVGQDYYVRVYGFSGTGNFELIMDCESPCLPVPLNDECSSPEVLSLVPFGTGSYTMGTNECAATESFNPTCDPFGTIQGVWYEFTTDASGEIYFSLDTLGADVAHYVLYEVAPCDGTTIEVDCQDPFGGVSFTDEFYTLSPSTTYKVMVYTNASEFGTFRLRVTGPPPPPANDDCEGAELLTVGTECVGGTAGTLISATESAAPALDTDCGTQSNGYNDVWYKAVIPASGRLAIDFPVQAGTNMFTELFTGANVGGVCTLSYLSSSCSAINPKIYPLPGTSIANQLTAGDTLYIRAWDAGNNDIGNFEVCIWDPVPANNNCLDAAVAPLSESGVSAWTTGSTEFAWSGNNCAGGSADEQVWYEFDATQSVQAIYARGENPGSTYDAVIEVFDGCGGSSLGCFNNYGAGSFERALVEDLTPGQTYYYTVHHSGGAQDADSDSFITGVRDFATNNLRAQDCGATGLTLENSIYCLRDDQNQIYQNPVILVTGYRFRFTEQGGGLEVEVERPVSNGFFVQLEDVPGLEYGKTYDVTVAHRTQANVNGALDQVWNDYGIACPITLGPSPTTSLRPEFCTALDDYVHSDQIQATPVIGADQYRFTFVGAGGPFTVTSANYALFLYEPGNGGLIYGNSYVVTVEVESNGVWSAPGAPCTLFMAPQPPNTEVRPQFCGQPYLFPQSNFILAESVQGASIYEFRFIGGGDTFTEQKNGISFQFHQTSIPFVPGTTYAVDVRAFAGGGWSDFVNACNITVLPAPELEGDDETADAQSFRALVLSDVDVNMYPNPNSGDAVSINLQNLEDEAQRIRLEVIDLTGKQVHYEELGNNGSEANFILDFASPLSKGMYFVNIYVNDELIVEKLTVN